MSVALAIAFQAKLHVTGVFNNILPLEPTQT